MKKMLLAASLLMTLFGSVSAMTLNEAQSQKFNLKHHAKHIAAYHAKVGKLASKELSTVVEGLKSGTYMYDLETARTVLREVYAHRMPKAPTNIQQ